MNKEHFWKLVLVASERIGLQRDNRYALRRKSWIPHKHRENLKEELGIMAAEAAEIVATKDKIKDKLN